MAKDYSEYKPTDYEKYRAQRTNRKGVALDFFRNKVRFFPEDKWFRIYVYRGHEHHMMQDLIDEYEAEIAARDGRELMDMSDVERTEMLENNQEKEEENAKLQAAMQKKYEVNFSFGEEDREYFHEKNPDKDVMPFVNIFSGAQVLLNYGEGILDFVYADFLTPLKQSLKLLRLFESLGEDENGVKREKRQREPEKIYNQTQVLVTDFFDYMMSFSLIRDVAYASLYSAICPPKFAGGVKQSDLLIWYGNYLLDLQKEYISLINFCFDDQFYPDVLGHLHPSERYALFRHFTNRPSSTVRTEVVSFSPRNMSGDEMPYGLPPQKIVERFKNSPKPGEQHRELAEKLGIPVEKLINSITVPKFMNIEYEFGSVVEMLELEFTKMLEANLRFRKCKRCGKYFIMKGKYDTNYCDRVAPGQTKNCQELAAIDNYKAKIADNKAIPIYNKYYKRYAARVKVRQNKEADFKKWKYQALTMRDDCAEGKISVEEYTQWMEDSFPNRKPKQDK